MSEKEPNITLQDIANTVRLIDLCSARGAFKGEELLAVGELRMKYYSFVEYSKKQESEKEEIEVTDSE